MQGDFVAVISVLHALFSCNSTTILLSFYMVKDTGGEGFEPSAGVLNPASVYETGAINHSATPPY